MLVSRHLYVTDGKKIVNSNCSIFETKQATEMKMQKVCLLFNFRTLFTWETQIIYIFLLVNVAKLWKIIGYQQSCIINNYPAKSCGISSDT